MDGLVNVFWPKQQHDSGVDEHTYHARPDLSLEEALQRIDEMPSPERIEAEFDFEAEYEQLRQSLLEYQAKIGDMV